MKKLIEFIKRILGSLRLLRLIVRIMEAIEAILQDEENNEK